MRFDFEFVNDINSYLSLHSSAVFTSTNESLQQVSSPTFLNVCRAVGRSLIRVCDGLQLKKMLLSADLL